MPQEICEGVGNLTKQEATALLTEKVRELSAAGEDRYPKRSDFSPEEVMHIKEALGPWPRALEEAGLKPPRSVDRLEANRAKRIRAKIRKRQNKN